MSIFRPIVLPVLRPVTNFRPDYAPVADDMQLYLLGADGTYELVETFIEEGLIAPISETTSSVTFEVGDTLVVAETDISVTLELGD